MCKKYGKCKNDYSWSPSTCICENSRYLKSITDGSVIISDEIINFAESVSKNMTNTVPTNAISTVSTNVTCTVSMNSQNKKVLHKMDCYILLALLLVTILLFTIAIFPIIVQNISQMKKNSTLTKNIKNGEKQ